MLLYFHKYAIQFAVYFIHLFIIYFYHWSYYRCPHSLPFDSPPPSPAPLPFDRHLPVFFVSYELGTYSLANLFPFFCVWKMKTLAKLKSS